MCAAGATAHCGQCSPAVDAGAREASYAPSQPGPSAEEAQQTIQELKADGARLQGRIRGLEEEVMIT